MQIKRIWRRDELEPLVKFVNGDRKLLEEIEKEFMHAEYTGHMYYVRYRRGFLQRMQVSLKYEDAEMLDRTVLSHDYWKKWE